MPHLVSNSWKVGANREESPLTSTASTLRADQQGCQNGLVEDHSGAFRIESIRPGSGCVGRRPGEVRPGEVRPVEEFRPLEVRIGEVCTEEVRPYEVRSRIDEDSWVQDGVWVKYSFDGADRLCEQVGSLRIVGTRAVHPAYGVVVRTRATSCHNHLVGGILYGLPHCNLTTLSAHPRPRVVGGWAVRVNMCETTRQRVVVTKGVCQYLAHTLTHGGIKLWPPIPGDSGLEGVSDHAQ